MVWRTIIILLVIFKKILLLNDLKENFKKLYSKLEAIEPETYLPVSDEQWENYIKSVIPGTDL